jgi:hypothetical protein
MVFLVWTIASAAACTPSAPAETSQAEPTSAEVSSPVTDSETEASKRAPSKRVVQSITPTPREWSGEALTNAFEIAARACSVVCLPDPVDWWQAEGREANTSKPFRDHQWQRLLIERNDLEVFIQIDPYRPHLWNGDGLPESLKGASFADPRVRRAAIADAVQRVRLYDPKYVCFGMEINTYFEHDTADFGNFVSLFREARHAMKREKPDVMVFPSFQYEQLLGIAPAEGGRSIDRPRWFLIDRFGDDLDAVGISSYPLQSFAPPRFDVPSKLPTDYYNQIARHTKKPIVFAELGYSSDSTFGGSEADQGAFLRRFPAMTDELDLRMVNYNFLYDIKGFGDVFNEMGLVDAEGNPKDAGRVWMRLWPDRDEHDQTDD